MNGLTYDVYTPVSTNPNNIVEGIANKKYQAVGVVVDLSQTTVNAEDLGDVMARLHGKGVTTIREVILMPK